MRIYRKTGWQPVLPAMHGESRTGMAATSAGSFLKRQSVLASGGLAHRQYHVEAATGTALGVIALAFHPYPAAVGLGHPAGDGQSQPCTSSHKCSFAGTVRTCVTHFVE